MKKLILISIIIFFAICSKSWAEDLNGKALHCTGSKNLPYVEPPTYIDYEYIVSYIFLNNRKVKYLGVSERPPFHIRDWDDHYTYTTDNKNIYFFYKDYKVFKINRKTLILSYIKEKWEYVCKLSTEIDIRNDLNRILNKYIKQKEAFDIKEREGNKI